MDLIVLQQYSTSGCPLRPAWSDGAFQKRTCVSVPTIEESSAVGVSSPFLVHRLLDGRRLFRFATSAATGRAWRRRENTRHQLVLDSGSSTRRRDRRPLSFRGRCRCGCASFLVGLPNACQRTFASGNLPIWMPSYPDPLLSWSLRFGTLSGWPAAVVSVWLGA